MLEAETVSRKRFLTNFRTFWMKEPSEKRCTQGYSKESRRSSASAHSRRQNSEEEEEEQEGEEEGEKGPEDSNDDKILCLQT